MLLEPRVLDTPKPCPLCRECVTEILWPVHVGSTYTLACTECAWHLEDEAS